MLSFHWSSAGLPVVCAWARDAGRAAAQANKAAMATAVKRIGDRYLLRKLNVQIGRWCPGREGLFMTGNYGQIGAAGAVSPVTNWRRKFVNSPKDLSGHPGVCAKIAPK